MLLQVGMQLLLNPDGDAPPAGSHQHPAAKQFIGTQVIKRADNLTGMKIDRLISFLKLVKPFENNNGYDNIMFAKMISAGGLMQNDVGIKDEILVAVSVGHCL